ncbi:serine/threonine-protein kinase fused-like [Planoprotostelium fungivorum]|uniref:Serine/threonine-protein kinase fused-like n=1 Tax=Planoprotostelium fungivorum TaxID=1890364 RepID=A0A2P6NBI1_9EUKA|nr:serine/threonine-protein kinase fused-like [Planoprotostelium fungivorum]
MSLGCHTLNQGYTNSDMLRFILLLTAVHAVQPASQMSVGTLSPDDELISPNGRWRLAWNSSSWLGVYEGLSPSFARWQPLSYAKSALASGRLFNANLTLRDNCSLVFQSAAGVLWNAPIVRDGVHYSKCNLSMDDSGVLMLKGDTILWKSSIIYEFTSPGGVEGGLAALNGSFWNASGINSFFNGDSVIYTISSDYVPMVPPMSNRPQLTLYIQIADSDRAYYSYNYPAFNVTSITGLHTNISILCGHNVGPSLALSASDRIIDKGLSKSPSKEWCLSLDLTESSGSTWTAISGGQEFNFTLPPDPPLYNKTVSVMNGSIIVDLMIHDWNGTVRFELGGSVSLIPVSIEDSKVRTLCRIPYNLEGVRFIAYFSFGSNALDLTFSNETIDVKSLLLQGLNDASPADVYSFVDRLVTSGLQNSTTYELRSANVSISAARLQSEQPLSLSVNESETRCYIPQDVIRDVATTSGDYAVLTQLTKNPFVTTNDTYTTAGNVIGLSIYNINGSLLSVQNSASLIHIIIPLPLNRSSSGFVCLWWNQKQRGWISDGCDTYVNVTSVTCLCDHLTNFTLGVVTEILPRSTNSLRYLPFIAAIALVSGIIIIVVLVLRKRKSTKHFDMKLSIITDVTCEREIGRGEKSVVYVGQKAGMTAVAVKKSEDRNKMLHETNTLRNLHHPNVLLYIETYSEGNMTCMVTEYMDKLDLHTYMTRTEVKSKEGKDIILQITSTIHYLHENNYVHGNIVPRKILVSQDGTVKLSSPSRAFVYTPQYTAPEAAREKKNTFSSDVWSVGTVAFKILSGSLDVHASEDGCIADDVDWSSLVTQCSSLRDKVEERVTMKALMAGLQGVSPKQQVTRPAGGLDNVYVLA